MQIYRAIKPAHEDERGTITDLVTEPVDAVTVVATKKGAVRGNHYHAETTQWAYVVSGMLYVKAAVGEAILNAGDAVKNPPGESHAWKALEDTVCVVFVQGPRAGDAYESDTIRLREPLFAA